MPYFSLRAATSYRGVLGSVPAICVMQNDTVILGSQGGEYFEYVPLGCDASKFCIWLLTFWRNEILA